MINVLYYDNINFDYEEATQIFKHVQAALPKGEPLIMLPAGCRLERLDDGSHKNPFLGDLKDYDLWN